MDITQRNRAIKAALAPLFGRDKIRVRGSRGTAYGWVSVRIDWTPLDVAAAQDKQTECKRLLRAAGIDLGHSYTDDTCQYSSDQCHIDFNTAQFQRTLRMSDGSLVGQRHYQKDFEVVAPQHGEIQ